MRGLGNGCAASLDLTDRAVRICGYGVFPNVVAKAADDSLFDVLKIRVFLKKCIAELVSTIE